MGQVAKRNASRERAETECGVKEYQSIVSVLVEHYSMRDVEIAAVIRASESAVRNWRILGVRPQLAYRKALAALLKEKQAA